MFRIEDTSAPATCAPPRSPPKSSYSEHNRRQWKRPKRLGAPRLNRTGSNETQLELPCRHRLRAWSATSALAPPAFITNTGKVPSIRRGCRRPQGSSLTCRSSTPSNSTTASSACRLRRPSARVRGRCSRLTPFPCATRPADTSCRAIRSHHSTM
jgi:hypothetical protein